MANNGSDGSIIIDTELDNTGFEKGSDKLLGSVKDLTAAVDTLGDNMMASFRAMTPILQGIANNTAQIYAAMTSEGQQAVNTNDAVTEAVQRQAGAVEGVTADLRGFQAATTTTDRDAAALNKTVGKLEGSMQNGFSNAGAVLRFKDTLDQAESQAATLRGRLEELGKARVPTEDYTFLTKAINDAANRLSTLKDRQDKMGEMGVKQNSKQWRSLAYDIEQVEQQIATYKAEMAALEANGGAFVAGVDTEPYKELSAQLETANEQIKRGKALIDAESIAQAQLNIQAAQEAVIHAQNADERAAALEQLKTAQAELNALAAGASGKGNGGGMDDQVSGLDRFRDALAAVKQQVVDTYQSEGLLAAGAEALKAAISGVTAPVHALGEKVDGVGDRLMHMGAEAIQTGTALGVLGGTATMLGGILTRVAGTALKVTATLAKLAGTAVVTVLERIGQAALTAAKNLARMAGKAITSGLDNLKSKLQSLSKANKQGTLTSNGLVKALTSVKTMLKSRIKRMFISYLMNEIKNAMSLLVQFSGAFNAAVSGMRNGATELGGNLAVMFSNVVNAIAPAITAIINMVSQATSYLNAFFAMLGGKSTVTVAKKQTDDYAKSLKDATGATKDLNKANKTLGIDELNVISDDSSSGGGAGSKKPADLYEEVAIDDLLPTDVSAWFDRIKAAFENGDWYGIGNIISEGLNTAMGTVDKWITGTLQPVANTWASRIAQALNGLVAGVDWPLMGQTVANGINTVFSVLHTFLTTFDFSGLGVGIGSAINGLFTNIDWALIGATFAEKWNALVYLIQGIASTVDWATVGSSIATAVSSWFTTIDWAALVNTVTTGFNGIVTAVHAFILETDWAGMATQLGTSVFGLLQGIDWVEIGLTIMDGITNLFNAARAFIEAIDWQQMGRDVVRNVITFLTTCDWGSVADALFGAIGAALGGLAAFIWGVVSEAWSHVVEWWHDTAFEDGQFTMSGLLNGIWEGIKGIGTWIKEHIFDPFINGFKSAFGIASPSTVMMEMGGYIIDGLKNGLTGLWDGIKGFFSDAVDGIKGFFSIDNLKSIGSNAVTGLMNGLQSVGNKVKEWGSGILGGIKNALGIHSPSTETEAVGEYTVAGLINGLQAYNANLQAQINSMTTTLLSMFKTMADNVINTSNGLYTTVLKSVTDLCTAISTQVTTMLTGLTTAQAAAQTASTTGLAAWSKTTLTLFTSLYDQLMLMDWRDIGRNLVAGVQKGINDAWAAFQKWVNQKFSTVTTTVKSAFGIKSPSRVFAEIGEYLDLGLMEGLKNGENGVLSTVKNLAGNVTDAMGNASPELEFSMNTAASDLSNVADTLLGIAYSFTAIADALTAMGGLQVPAVAAGTVAPYQTRVAQESPQTGAEGLNTVISEGNAELLAAIAALADRVVAAIQENGGDLYIGDEQIVRSYDRGDAARGVRVSRGAFANVY